MPDGEVGQRLATWIEKLADRFRTERFPPHVAPVPSWREFAGFPVGR